MTGSWLPRGAFRGAIQLAPRILLVGLVCHVSTEIGFAHKFPPHYISPLWPTGAILFSVLVATPVRQWWAYTLAAYFTSILNDVRAGFPASAAFFIAAGMAEILIAAVGVRRYAGGVRAFHSLRSLVVYLAIAVVLAPFASAFVGALAGGARDYWFYWRVWFLSEALAYLVLAPAILTAIGVARAGRLRIASRARFPEAISLGVGLLGVSVWVFESGTAGAGTVPALVYFPLPFLLWAAVRFGPPGVNTCLSMVALLSISGAVRGRGPFAIGSPDENVLSLQMFLFALSLPLIFLAALVAERRERTSALRESEARFRSLADTTPVLIWMSGADGLGTFFNKGWLDFTGRPLEKELGIGWTELVHPDDRERVVRTYRDAFRARLEFNMDYRLRRHDGAYRWLLDKGVPRRAQDETFLGYIGCAQDVTDRKHAEQAAQDLSGRLIRAQEEERSRLARELHDDVTQRLASVAIDLARLEGARSASIWSEALHDARERLARLSDDVHTLSYQLHPSVLEDLGLVDALRAECERFTRREGILAEVRLRNLGDNPRRDVAICLFRVAQEALRNVVRHARASAVEVSLGGIDGGLQLSVRDDGVGFDPSGHRPPSLGHASMRERTRLLGGELDIESAPGAGTTIVAWIPHQPAS